MIDELAALSKSSNCQGKNQIRQRKPENEKQEASTSANTCHFAVPSMVARSRL